MDEPYADSLVATIRLDTALASELQNAGDILHLLSENWQREEAVVSLTENHRIVLRILAERPEQSHLQAALEAAADISRRTLNELLEDLRQHNLVVRSHGERSGEQITKRGLETLKENWPADDVTSH